jgi:hypothetical protein
LKKQSENLMKSLIDTAGLWEVSDLAHSESDPELEALEAHLEASAPGDLISLSTRESLWADLQRTFREHFRADL